MGFMPFDTLAYAKRLEKSGFTREQAVGMTYALLEALGYKAPEERSELEREAGERVQSLKQDPAEAGENSRQE